MGKRDDYVAAIKDGFVSLGTKALMAFLVVEVPFFATPIANYLARHLIDYLLTKLTDFAELQIFFAYIDFRVSDQGKDFINAVTENLEAKKNGTPEEKLAAELALIDRARNFIKLTN